MIRRTTHRSPITRATRILVALLPVYVAVLTALAAVLGPGFPIAEVPIPTVAALTVVALTVFAAAVFFINRWEHIRRAKAHTGAATERRSSQRNVAELLAIVTGAPPSQAAGYFVALIVSGGVSVGLNFAAVRCVGGTSIALQIPISVVAYTLVFWIAMYVNGRGAECRGGPDRDAGSTTDA